MRSALVSSKGSSAPDVLDYVRRSGLFEPDAQLDAEEIGDGNINFVFRVGDGAGSVIVKRALPYFKAAGEGYALGLGRSQVEAEALQLIGDLAPGSVPRLFCSDPELGMMIMEDMAPLPTMRNAMLAMQRFPAFAEQMATMLAKLGFYTSAHASPSKKRELGARFANPELCKITDDLIFTAPYRDDPINRVQPALRPYLERWFWPREDIRLEAACMKRKFQTAAECLIHGDLHTGSIFADIERTVSFDCEFATIGPAAFDIGKLLGNLVINHHCWSGRDAPEPAVRDYRVHVRQLICATYAGFARISDDLLAHEATDFLVRGEAYRQRWQATLLEDALGFCATTMIRRMFGLAQNVDVEGIEDLQRRREVQVMILELAADILLHRSAICDVEELAGLVERSV